VHVGDAALCQIALTTCIRLNSTCRHCGELYVSAVAPPGVLPGLLQSDGHREVVAVSDQRSEAADEKSSCCSRLLLVLSKAKGSPYSIAERRVPELIPVLGSQPAGDVSYKPGGRLPVLSSRPAVTPATLKRAATNFAAW